MISHFSVPGYETLAPEFSDYIESSAAFIPPEYPIVLEISGCRFSEEEQEVIRSTIHEDYTYPTVYFSKEYDDSAVTNEDAQTVYEELEKMAEQDRKAFD